MNERYTNESIGIEHQQAIAAAERFGPYLPVRRSRIRSLVAFVRGARLPRVARLVRSQRRTSTQATALTSQRSIASEAPTVTDPLSP